MKIQLLSLTLFLLVLAMGHQTAVPMEEEPHHHVLLKNESVVVVRATLAPGESTEFHVHSHDRAGVELAKSTTTEQLWGQPEGPASTSETGEVYAEPCTKCPITHRVHNVGHTTMDVFNVELLQRPAQPAAPPAARVAAENASARVYKWVIAPGSATAMHTHLHPYVIVAVTPMRLKMTAPGGRSLSEEVRRGDFHWINAKVTHALANESAVEGQIVEIELK